MKRLFLIILSISFLVTQLAAQQIIRAEYFIDSGPATITGTEIPITPGTSLETSFNLPTLGLSAGFHYFLIRVLREDGLWSNTLKQDFYIYDTAYTRLPASPGPTDLNLAAYFIDDGPEVMVPISQGTSVQKTLDIVMQSLTPGFHSIFFKVRNTNNFWSSSMIKEFYIFDPSLVRIQSGNNLVGGEYFFDDPNTPEGSGFPIVTDTGSTIEFYGDINLSGIGSGVHQLYIRVKNGSNQWSTPISAEFNVADWAIVTNSPICFGINNGTAFLDIKSGDGPFTYLWSDQYNQTTATASNLKPGKYFVTATDQQRFSIIDSVQIIEYDSIKIQISTINSDCNQDVGSATASLDGTYPPFNYEWTTGSSDPTITNLKAGLYYLTVTDNKNCKSTGVAPINNLNGPRILLSKIKDVSCYKGNDGSINISVLGGTTPYTFFWSNGMTSEDINDIPAGNYEITVSDVSGCSASMEIIIKQPDIIKTSFKINLADCGKNNGKAEAIVTGGTKPYSYLWENGGNTSVKNNIGLGLYDLQVTDVNNCKSDNTVAMGEKNAPDIRIIAINEATCGNNDGSVFTSLNGNPDFYNFLWSTAANTQDLINAAPGNYSLKVTDTVGCNSVLNVQIPVIRPEIQSICLVTVDSASNNNEIFWEKPVTSSIDHYNVYRESSQIGQYTLIGEEPYEIAGIFIDSLSNPSVRSYRYKISAIDTCGIESFLSESHKTIHLAMNIGLNNVINLDWSKYEGFPVSTYIIWRYSLSSGWKIIAEMSSDNNTYTDASPPSGFIEYYIEVLHPNGCSVSTKKAQKLNSSRSNRTSNHIKSTGIVTGTIKDFNCFLFPNPTSGMLNASIVSSGSGTTRFSFLNSTGEVLFVEDLKTDTGSSNYEFNLMYYPKGVYFMKVLSGKTNIITKIILL